MPNRSSRPRDANQLAAAIVAETTGDFAPGTSNPHAVALGRLGGLKGGPERAKRFTKKRQSQIAKMAAQARLR